jgi:anti-anti-sigma regulatory factor
MNRQKMTKAQLLQEIEKLEQEKQAVTEGRVPFVSQTVLKGINEVFQEALTCTAIEELALKCLSVAERITSSKFGFIGEINDMGLLDTLALSDPGWQDCRIGESETTVMINNMKIRGLWSLPLKTGKSVIVDQPAGHAAAVGVPSGHPELTALLCVPLLQGANPIGVITLGNKPGGYGREDQLSIESIAVAVAETIAKKRTEIALEQQTQEMLEMSVPVLSLWRGIVAVPLIGTLDSNRTQMFMERFLGTISAVNARISLLDITGVPTVDTQTAQHLIEAVTAAKLLGNRVIMTGIRPAIAQTLVHLGIDLSMITTCASLEAGLRLALQLMELEVVPAQTES